SLCMLQSSVHHLPINRGALGSAGRSLCLLKSDKSHPPVGFGNVTKRCVGIHKGQRSFKSLGCRLKLSQFSASSGKVEMEYHHLLMVIWGNCLWQERNRREEIALRGHELTQSKVTLPAQSHRTPPQGQRQPRNSQILQKA